MCVCMQSWYGSWNFQTRKFFGNQYFLIEIFCLNKAKFSTFWTDTSPTWKITWLLWTLVRVCEKNFQQKQYLIVSFNYEILCFPYIYYSLRFFIKSTFRFNKEFNCKRQPTVLCQVLKYNIYKRLSLITVTKKKKKSEETQRRKHLIEGVFPRGSWISDYQSVVFDVWLNVEE